MTIARVGRSGRRAGDGGVVALEFALTLPLVALVLVALSSVAGLVRTALVLHDAARVGARLAAVEPDDAVVVDAVTQVAGAGADVAVGPRHLDQVVVVEVRDTVELVGLDREVVGRAAAVVEPGIATPRADDRRRTGPPRGRRR